MSLKLSSNNTVFIRIPQLGIFLCLSVFSIFLRSQERPINYGTELLIGITTASNSNFPDRSLQKQIHFKAYRESKSSDYFSGLSSGVGLGVTDFGNRNTLGYAFTIMPYLEFPIFKSNRISLLTGLGASYFTKKYDFENNFTNRAVSTDITWSFRAYINYKIIKTDLLNYAVGAGLFHHSNGHLKLPNNGYNSILISLGATLNRGSKQQETKIVKPTQSKGKEFFIESRLGTGWNAFNDGFPFNNKKGVHTISTESGLLFSNRFKVGIGAFYRFYKHYYDYLKNNESLVQEGREFESLKQSPFWNASNVALYVKGEVLLNHVGIELLIGANLHKPAYKIDWRINEGWDFAPRDIPLPPSWELGEFGSKYKFKQSITTRIGLKYYLKDTQRLPIHNWYGGVFLNANLGQADFTEVGVGYIITIPKS